MQEQQRPKLRTAASLRLSALRPSTRSRSISGPKQQNAPSKSNTPPIVSYSSVDSDEDQQLQAALESLLHAGGLVSTYRRRMKRYKDSFLGINAKYVLTDQGIAQDQTSAHILLQKLVNTGQLVPADGGGIGPFDERSIYKFSQQAFQQPLTGTIQHGMSGMETTLSTLEDSMVLLDDKLSNQVVQIQLATLALVTLLICCLCLLMVVSNAAAMATVFFTGVLVGVTVCYTTIQQYPNLTSETVESLIQGKQSKAKSGASSMQIGSVTIRSKTSDPTHLSTIRRVSTSNEGGDQDVVGVERPLAAGQSTKADVSSDALDAELFNGMWEIDRSRSGDGEKFLRAFQVNYLLRRAILKSRETKKIDFNREKLVWKETKSYSVVTREAVYYLDEREEVKEEKGMGQVVIRSKLRGEFMITDYEYSNGCIQTTERKLLDPDTHVSVSTLTQRDGSVITYTKVFVRTDSS